MSSERGQRTRLRIGEADVEVSLYKTSGPMPEAKHETIRVDPVDKQPERATPSSVLTTDAPFSSHRGRRSTPSPEPVVAKYRHGVTVNDKFVDLTEQLAAIDEENKLDAAVIDATVPVRSLPRMRIRDAYFVAPAEPDATPFLAHLWIGLRKTDSAAIIRWSKRTNQALGALVATYDSSRADGQPILVLIELEWVQAMREAPSHCGLEDAVASVHRDSAEAVIEAMRELRRTPDVWQEMRDERNAQRAELLEAARAGRKWAAPEPVQDSTVALGEAILAAAR